MCCGRIGAVVADIVEGFQLPAEETLEACGTVGVVELPDDFLAVPVLLVVLEVEELGLEGGEGTPIWDMAAMFQGERTLSVVIPEGAVGDMEHFTKGP